MPPLASHWVALEICMTLTSCLNAMNGAEITGNLYRPSCLPWRVLAPAYHTLLGRSGTCVNSLRLSLTKKKYRADMEQ
ncbi:hypothetical protein BDV97DRAFT_362328 [Delphinella strobiligena]|nr:hypothetical protein BDV97DRAFT_362328 [Delphinella strobiligena]